MIAGFTTVSQDERVLGAGAYLVGFAELLLLVARLRVRGTAPAAGRAAGRGAARPRCCATS